MGRLEHKYGAAGRRFTLVETLVALAIATIITGGALAYMLRSPSSVLLSNTALSIERLMLTAQSQASLRGRARALHFDPDRNLFYIADKTDGDMPENPIDHGHNPADMPHTQTDTLKLDSQMEVEFPGTQEGSLRYLFFPDGTAAGTPMTVALKNLKRTIRVSHLAGTIHNENITDED